jgi:transposase
LVPTRTNGTERKKKTTRAAEQDRADLVIERRQWRVTQTQWDARKLVFIDETGVNTKMARRYGRSLIGQRCASAEPHGHWQSSTFLAALRYEKITAPFFLEGAVDADAFTAYLQQVLCPELQEGDRVILDNLATHKIAAVEPLITARGASVHYLPAYSPDLNPIEQAFSKLKAHLRQAAARSLDQLIHALARGLDAFTPEHCRNFFHDANYATM